MVALVTDPYTRLTPDQIADVLAKHEDMVWWMANRLHAAFPAVETEDIAGEIRFRFVRSARDFNPALGFKFSTYAVRNAWMYAIRFARREKARGLRCRLDLDPPALPATVPVR
jgi:DNA-directed RNA polymerase specialized sigma subunit